MKRKQLRFIGYCLTIGLITALTMVMVSCSSTSTSVSTPTSTTTPILSAIDIEPTYPQNLAVGDTQQFTATGTYLDGATADITSQVTWANDNVKTAIIDSTGKATGIAAGTVNIKAVLLGVISPAVSLTMVAAASAPTLSAIDVEPASPASLAAGDTQQFTATGTYSDGATADITAQVTWASATTGIATIDAAGKATGVAAGTANITATKSGITSPTISLTVLAAATGPKLSSIDVEPASPPSLAVGATAQFTATGTYSDGSTGDITARVAWVIDTTGTVTIDSTGKATGIATGTAKIKAVLLGVTSPVVSLPVQGATSITPTTTSAPIVSSINILRFSWDNLPVGSTQQFIAVGTYSDGSTANMTSQVTWTSSNINVATISSAGFATALTPGNTFITASLSGVSSPNLILTVGSP